MSDWTSLLSELERFRNRAIRVAFIRYASTGAAAALILGAAVTLLWREPNASRWTFIIATVAAAILSAGVIATLRKPNLHEAARQIDASCRFDECIGTAVQCASSGDAFSQLVVQQALRRINSVTPAAAYPYRWGLESRLLAGAGLTAILVLAASGLRLPDWRGVPVVVGGSSDNAGTAAAAGQGLAPSRPALPSAPPAAPASTTGAPAGPPQSEQPTQAGVVASQNADAATMSRTADAARPHAPAGNGGVRGGISPEGQSRGSASAGGDARTQPRAGAGGVSNGKLSRAGNGQPVIAPPPGYGARYGDAAGRAEDALVREQVPAELRDVVRAYFTAIRP